MSTTEHAPAAGVLPKALAPAEAYERFLGPAIFAPLAAKVLAVLTPPAGSDVIDVACGTGILTRRAAERAGAGARVTGVDLNPEMISLARTRIPPDVPPIDFLVGDGTALDFAADSFDVAYCQQGLQFFPDRVAGARELRRVLRPGGQAVLAVWQGLEQHPFFTQLFQIEEPYLRALGAEGGMARAAAPFSFGDAGALAATLDSAGFAQVDVSVDTVYARFPEPDRYIAQLEAAYAAVVPLFATDPAEFERYVAAVTAASHDLVASYLDGDDLVVPMHTHLALAR